ncbi:helix-turn-helix domain-containing protein [Clostridium beijerinckii]|uniref:Transcriptional regulator with XRE-family HTH domain n=1 Tax=Clostridium beijerinckii TaxID=1520 RepID=A0AAE5H1M7_CLOBE|nr:helix-turn-helix transcriptional regulator [Clostridium beijerinckii]NSB13023.1 transcriptional regulator with XRE-family HTH domain [Clostridium beijerinckii]OOM22125.1 antitoxin HipB [Clostridium beijerinckii]
MNIGNNIKRIRTNKKISQKDFAIAIDMPISTLANYENNHREPNIETLTKIADALGIPVSKLLEDDTFNLTDTNTERAESYIDLIIGKPELKPLINIFRSKGYELRQEIKGFDIYLIKNEKAIAKIPEKDFADFGAKMLYVINEFTDFEFSKLIDTFTFLSLE